MNRQWHLPSPFKLTFRKTWMDKPVLVLNFFFQLLYKNKHNKLGKWHQISREPIIIIAKNCCKQIKFCVSKKLRKLKVGHEFGVVLSLVTRFCRKPNTKKERFKTATYLDAHFSFFRLLVPIIFSYLIFQQYICKCKSEIFFLPTPFCDVML